MTDRAELVVAFAVEYRALCEKHGLVIVFDGDYTPHEVRELQPRDFDDEWRLWHV